MKKTKQCTKCERRRLIKFFNIHIRYADGYMNWCKACVYDNKERWRKDNIEHERAKQKIYRQSPAGKAWRSNYRKKDLRSKLADITRARIYCFIKSKGIRKKKPTAQLIGCSWLELRKHLEAQFKPGMSWENYGQWHIDHIIPMSKLKDNLEKSCHYKNLQPLWAQENLIKSNKY